jgi:hypothetical protein
MPHLSPNFGEGSSPTSSRMPQGHDAREEVRRSCLRGWADEDHWTISVWNG